jgi:hypothetical protein
MASVASKPPRSQGQSIQRPSQRARSSTAAALLNATRDTRHARARFEATDADKAWWAANAPRRYEHYDVIGRRPPNRPSGFAPSERYTESSAEAMESHGSFVGHDA